MFAGPGAGKTLGSLLAFCSMRQEGRLERLVVLCHRTSILEQWQRSSRRLGLELCHWPERSTSGLAGHGLLLTYQAAARQLDRLQDDLAQWDPDTTLVVADEAHHLGVDPEEPDAAVWGQTFQEISHRFRLRLGLTGTPFRADNLAFCAARRVRLRQGSDVVEQIIPDLCVEPRDLIAAGDVRPLEFRFQDGWVSTAARDAGSRCLTAVGRGTRKLAGAQSRRAIRWPPAASGSRCCSRPRGG